MYRLMYRLMSITWKIKKILDVFFYIIQILNHLNLEQVNGLKINVDARGALNANDQIKLTILILKSSLCGESNAYILVEWTITITGAGADAATRSVNRTNKQVTLKDVEQFTYCIS